LGVDTRAHDQHGTPSGNDAGHTPAESGTGAQDAVGRIFDLIYEGHVGMSS